MFRRQGPSKEVIQANKNKIEANKIDRVVTFVIKNCVECPSLNKVRLQSEQFLIQCMKDDVTTFKVSSPELLRQMFEKCLYWPTAIEEKDKTSDKSQKHKKINDPKD